MAEVTGRDNGRPAIAPVWRTRLLLVLALLLSAGGASLAGHATADDAGPPTGAVRVVGGHLERDGVPWVPRGATLLAVLAPDGVNHSQTDTAASWFGPAELTAAHAWGMDVLRFQVSERGLDPQDALHTQAYEDRVSAAVGLARASGFSVIVSMQDQALGGGNRSSQPGPATLRAWSELAPLFGSDPGVLFELFNEPQNKADAAGWALWRNGDETGNQIGHQALVDRIRGLGAENVLLADGAQFARVLTDVPALTDPLHQTAYAIHPYLVDSTRYPSQWDAAFGFLGDRIADPAPVVATEWNAASNSGTCKPDWGDTAPQLVTYLRGHGIGLIAWPFDSPGWLVSDNAWTPTELTPFSCSVAGRGAGTLVRDEFLRDDPPALRVLRPENHAVVGGGGAAMPIDVRAADDGGPVDVVVAVDGQPLATTTSPETSASWDAGTATEGAHTLTVTVTDAAGQTTTEVRTVLVRHGAPVPPPTPAGLTATPTSATSVVLSWTAVAPAPGGLPIAGYQVFRDGSSTPVATSADPTWTDASVRPGTHYTYAVAAVDAGVPATAGPPTAPVAVTTPADALPTRPTGLAVTGRAQTNISLAWSPSRDDHGVAGYRVYRDGKQVGSPTSTWYVDPVAAGSTHSYTVAALDTAAQTSARSASVSATAPANPTGLLGSYATSAESALGAPPRMSRVDATVAFNWGLASPTPAVPADDVFVRWTGSLRSPATGRYTLTVTADDGARLWIGGTLVLDRWVTPGAGSVTVALTAGQATPIRLEMQDRTGTASARLSWSGPGTSAGTVPTTRLRPS